MAKRKSKPAGVLKDCRTVAQVVADATRMMVLGTFRNNGHPRICICRYCENSAALLLSTYEQEIEEARQRAKGSKSK